MTFPTKHRINYLLVLVCALFGVGAMFGVLQLRAIQYQLDTTTIAHGVWTVSQGEGRLLDFMNITQEYIRDPSVEKETNLREVFDILWSRYGVLSSGRVVKLASAFPGYTEAIAHFKDTLVQIDALFDPLTPASALQAYELLKPLQHGLHEMLLRASQRATANQVANIDAFRNVTLLITSSLAILLISGAMAIYLFRRESRRATTEMNARLNIEAELRAAKEEAEAANTAKTLFLAKMSHELRTPLNAIIGFSSLIRWESLGDVGNPKYIEYAEDINLSGTYLLELISDVLDLSVIESGGLTVARTPFDTTLLLQGCEAAFRSMAVHKSIDFQIVSPETMPSLLGDLRRMKQILFNLLSNAFKFTPDGGKITLSVRHDRDGVHFSVADTGCGIPEHELSRILMPFTQVTGGSHRDTDGVGLGLAIVKHLTELHDGKIDIQSTPGSGTEVTLMFPPERIAEPAGVKDGQKAGH